MENFLMVFYILFFATGFMGGAALFLLSIRVRSRLLRPLLAFQFLFLIATGLIVLYFYLESRPGGLAMPVSISLLVTIVGINAAVWGMVILLIRRISPPPSRRKGTPATAELLAWLVIAHSIANMALMMATSGEDEMMMDIIDAFNNMDVDGVFAHSADTVRMSSADGTTMQMTKEAMSGWFASMDSVKWDVAAVIPVQREEGNNVSVIVDGMQTDYYKDGTVDSYRLMERFVFTDGVMNRVYQYTAVIPEESAD